MKKSFLILLTSIFISTTPVFAIEMEELGNNATVEIETMGNPSQETSDELNNNDATVEIETMEAPSQEISDELKNITIEELFARGYALKVSIAYTPGVVIFNHFRSSKNFRSNTNSYCSTFMNQIEKKYDRILRKERSIKLYSIHRSIKDRNSYFLKASDTTVSHIKVIKADNFSLRDITPHSIEQDCRFLKILEIVERETLQDASVNTQRLNESYI